MATLSGESMWSIFEAEGLSVDEELKNILKAAKCDNMLILSTFCKDDRTKLEKFMSETLHEVIGKDNLPKYYGIYVEQPSRFKLVAGQEKQLDLITKISKRLIGAAAAARSTGTEATNSNLATVSKIVQRTIVPTPSSKSKGSSAADEKVTLDKNINGYLANTYEGKHEVSANVSEDGLGSFIAHVLCPLCKKEKKITKTGSRWNTTNFYTHLRIHVIDKSDAKIRKISEMFEASSSSVEKGGTQVGRKVKMTS